MFFWNLGLRLAFAGPLFIFYLWAEVHGRSDLEAGAMVLAAVAFVGIEIYTKKSIDMRRRLLDLFPADQQPKTVSTDVASYLLVLSIPLYFYLLIAKVRPGQAMPLVFRRLGLITASTAFISLIVPFLSIFSFALGEPLLVSPRLTYWVAPPGTQYLSELVDETETIETENRRLMAIEPTSFNGRFPISELAKVESITGASLLEIGVLQKAQDVKGNSSNRADQVRAMIGLLNGSMDVIQRYDRRRPVLLRMNPLNFIIGVGLLEASVLAVIEHHLEIDFNQKFSATMWEKIKAVEMSEDPRLQEAARAVRAELAASKMYRSFQTRAPASGSD